jgi:hypothetical protein
LGPLDHAEERERHDDERTRCDRSGVAADIRSKRGEARFPRLFLAFAPTAGRER